MRAIISALSTYGRFWRPVFGRLTALADDEPRHAGQGHRDRDEQVEPQAQEVRGGIDPDGFLEDPVPGVPGHVEGEQAWWLDVPVMAEPDQGGGQGQVEDQ